MPPKRQQTPYVQDRKSYGENLVTREMHPTDGNMQGFQEMYGNGEPNWDATMHMSIDQTVKRFRELYGDEQAIQVLDELVRIQSEAGSKELGNPSKMTEIESYGNARMNPTDANVMGHEGQYGYAPSVSQQPNMQQTPFAPPQRPAGPMNAFALQSRRK